MLKKAIVVIFTRLLDPIIGISCNKETLSVDVLEFTHAE